MKAGPKMEDLSLRKWDEEFSPRCTAKGCGERATWLGWVTHSFRNCPHSGYMCTRHRDKVQNWWENLMRATEDYELRCDICKVAIEGQLSDNLRWLPL